jgi:hypothetical protein
MMVNQKRDRKSEVGPIASSFCEAPEVEFITLVNEKSTTKDLVSISGRPKSEGTLTEIIYQRGIFFCYIHQG